MQSAPVFAFACRLRLLLAANDLDFICHAFPLPPRAEYFASQNDALSLYSIGIIRVNLVIKFSQNEA